MNYKDNKKSSNIQTSFDAKELSNYSGLTVLNAFSKKLGMHKLFSGIDINLHHNYHFSTSQVLSSIVLGHLGGLNRVSKIENFSRDPLVQRMLGLAKPIDADTIANRINRFDKEHNNQLMSINGDLSSQVHKKLNTCEDILDIDSTVFTVYGNQEGAAKGYNPSAIGRKSYHPLLGFLNSTKECILSWLRPGNDYTSKDSDKFIKQLFAILPDKIDKLMVRTDSGFFGNNFLSAVEARPNTEYVVKVKMRNMSEFLSNKQWEKIPEMPKWEMCKFEHQAKDWDKARTFVALREDITEPVDNEGRLIKIKKYKYFCYVTNIDDSPLMIHKIYGDRGECENWIEAVKNQMFAGAMRTKHFDANQTLWQLGIIAYNLSLWLRKLTDHDSWKEEPATFRAWFIILAGKITRTGRKVFLKMYSEFYYKQRWRKIENAVNDLVFA